MSSRHVVRSTPIHRTSRVAQLEGLFDVSPVAASEQTWDVTLPLDEQPWHIGLVVGPSGAGKTTIATEVFGADVVTGFRWSKGKAIVDDFPRALSIKEITELLSSVGFSSPPAWLRPYHVLSTGEQFRVTLARAMAQQRSRLVIDEFTSTVDRTVAQIGSAAVGKAVRRRKQQLVAVTCHYDVLDWLQPDWVFEPHVPRFTWRHLQRRPRIRLTIRRVSREAWALFRRHHYLNANLHVAARCYLATWREVPVAFTAVLSTKGFAGKWREHRTVCLPDFQGVGIGAAMSATVARLVLGAVPGCEYRSVTSHPAFIQSRRRSDEWAVVVPPAFGSGERFGVSGTRRKPPRLRLAATFRYTGQPWPDHARARALWEESLTATTAV